MRMYRDVAMMALGAALALACEKYKEPVMKKMNSVMDDAIDKAQDKLEQMK